jgi:hypothetical protein
LALAAAVPLRAQDKPMTPPVNSAEARPVNSFFERGPAKEYALKTVYVGGEVENPGPVELSKLPLRGLAVKELALENGAPVFKGAYFFTGYSLYDILNFKPVKKVNSDFSPETDLYVVVENDKGEKAVFSWGEIYYTRYNFNSLIPRNVRPINPSKGEETWPLPAVPRLICGGDLYNDRYIANPTKITVKSVPGVFPGEKHAAAFSPELEIVYGGTTTVVSDPAGFSRGRGNAAAAYGHGMGYKGLKTTEGFLLKDMLLKAGVKQHGAGSDLVVISAKDGYRSSFSLAEILDRNDSEDFMVVDKGLDDQYDGRFALFVPADFFVDRNVRSIAKVEILKL